MMRARLIGFVAAAIALAPLAAAASDTDDALKLAQRVAARGGFTEATVTLHAPPKDLPASVPLPKATLLGSVVEKMSQNAWTTTGGRVLGSTSSFVVSQPTMLYYDAPAGRDAAVTTYEAALAQAGWKPAPDIRRRIPIPQGGFQFNQFPAIKQWCSPDAHTAVTITNRQEPNAFDITLLSAGRSVDLQCSDAPSPFDAFMQRSPLPTFSAPSGITITASGPASDG